ncbi:MAG: fatty acid desaturase [Planctomycetales bacterium]|nr:fatty acid desaturase [Planctomycetales bacterium]
MTKATTTTAPQIETVEEGVTLQTASSHDGSLTIPSTAEPIQIYWRYLIPLVSIHGLALFAFVPSLFSWTGLVLAILGHLTFGMLGVCVGYHRLLTHHSFTCPKWLEYTLAILGICSFQDSPARWVAIHRLHHRDSDHQPDPHSPLVHFLWGHVGWLVVHNREHHTVSSFERYVRDLLRDPFYLRLERGSLWLFIYLGHTLLYFAGGFLYGWLVKQDVTYGLWFGTSLFLWGAIVRTVFVLNGTWAVNSIAHLWGYRNYETSDNSRNNWLVALLAHGEGWHNNHHADQRSAQHGHRWWEIDMAWWVIRFLEAIGLAKDVVRPKKSA